MSRGQLTRRTKLLKHPLVKCKGKGACSNVVIIDVPETVDHKEKGYAVPVMDKGLPSNSTIVIDDEDSVDVLSTSDVEELDDVNSNASSTKTCESSSCQAYIVEDSDNDECQAREHGRSSFRPSNCKERYVKGRPSKRGPSCSYFSHISSSEDDDSDCELLEPSLEIRAEWEKAALRKQKGKGHQNDHFEVEDQTSVSGFGMNPKTFSCHTQKNVDVGNKVHVGRDFENEQSTEAPTSSNSDNGVHGGEGEHTSRCARTANRSMEDISSRPAGSEDGASSVCRLSKSSVQNSDFEQVDSSNINLGLGKEGVLGEQTLSDRKLPNDPSRLSSAYKDEGDLLEFQDDLIGDREKLKATDAYRLADQEEWESRHRELRMQAEEAQRLRKKKKAETLRLLDMERRQKQRLEEVRQTQKRDEETMNLKEQLRTEIRRKLDQFELIYKDMASLLRDLGIQVGGTHYPTENEVNAAYKKALVRFHPDRASRTDIRQQIEAEETFKMICRLKDKLPLALNYLFPMPKPPW